MRITNKTKYTLRDNIVTRLFQKKEKKNTVPETGEPLPPPVEPVAGNSLGRLMEEVPFCCVIWNKSLRVIDCNEETARLFGLKDKRDFIDHFYTFSPENQPDSGDSVETAMMYIKKAFAEGRCEFEWTHRRADGTLWPARVALKRVNNGGGQVVAAYIHDMREVRQMMDALEKKGNLMNIGSQAAALLSVTDEGMFESSLLNSMELLGSFLDMDRVGIWQNVIVNGAMYFSNRYEWLSGAGRQAGPIPRGKMFLYSDRPKWLEKFLRHACINGPLGTLPPGDRRIFASYGIQSVLFIPVFLQDEFWGFTAFSNCHREYTFAEDEINIIRSVSLMMVNAIKRNAFAAQKLEANKRLKLMIDATPLAFSLWTRNLKNIDCNAEAVKLFRLSDRQLYLDRYFDLSPEYQPDGQRSPEKARKLLIKTFEEGKCVFEWLHKTEDGEPLPAEVTLVRVAYENDYVVAGYIRDLREHKRMMRSIEERDLLLSAMNNAAITLLQMETDGYEHNLRSCMEQIGESVKVDRIYICKNHYGENRLMFSQLFEWAGGAEPQQNTSLAVNISYDELPGWEQILSAGRCINSPSGEMPPRVREYLAQRGIRSVFIAPVFLQDQFWGFAGYDDCGRERLFSENEQATMRSGGLLIANALQRNEMTQSIRAAATKLEAVVASYSGIIWCIDLNYIITLYKGRQLVKLGKESTAIEGRKFDSYLKKELYTELHANVQKTFHNGPQNWISEIEGRTYHVRTVPVLDECGLAINVVGSFDDITELRRLQDELETALKNARQANQAKSDFLASMSHEMRTPLNAIIGLSALNLEAKSLRGDERINTEKVYNAGASLLTTVNDILDISKIEAGKLELVKVEYDVPSVLNDSITQSILHIGEKPVRFILDIDESMPARLYGDDLRIRQILNNLLSNAFKYTREGTVELRVDCVRDGDSYWLSARVSDTGIGIRKEDMDKLFTEFAKMDLHNNRKIEGTGLGLPITKRIAAMMDGNVTVESEYGKGSVFTVKIRQGIAGGSAIGAEVVQSLKSLRYSEHKRRNGQLFARIKLPYARVLVVDDVETNLDVARGMMKPYAMRIDCVSSGPEAIEAVRGENVKYDAIFMDHMMPGMDGIEATRVIREEIGTEYAKKIPIIALTANAITGNEKLFLENGFQAFISKPIEVGRLDSVIRQWIRNKDMEKVFPENEYRITEDEAEAAGNGQVPAVTGINMDRGLRRFYGDGQSYKKVLRSYSSSTRPLLRAMKDVSPEKLHDYAITVHGIKGSSRGICAETVADMAEALENAAHAENYGFIDKNNAAFIEITEKLADDIDKALAAADTEHPKPRKSAVDKTLLAKIAGGCEKKDIDEIDAAMVEIEAFDYENDEGLAAWLRENVDRVNFKQIIERLKKEL